MNVAKIESGSKGQIRADKSRPSKAKKDNYYQSYDSEPLIVSDFEMPYVRRPRYEDDISFLKRSKEGLSAKTALDFLELSGISHDQFQYVFKTTVKTIQNYAAKQLVLDAALSEKLIKLLALFELGAGVFGGATYFNQWIHTKAYGLGYMVPLEMMETITGIKLIEEQLLRIAYGDLA